jgi:hypothetical protein
MGGGGSIMSRPCRSVDLHQRRLKFLSNIFTFFIKKVKPRVVKFCVWPTLRVGVVGVKLKLNLAQLELGLSLAKRDLSDLDEFGLLFLLVSKEKQYPPHCWEIF